MITENENEDPQKAGKIKKREVIYPDGKKKMLNVSDGIGFQLFEFSKINSNTTKYTQIIIGVASSIKSFSKIIFLSAAKSISKTLKEKVEKNFEHFSSKDLTFKDLDPKISFFYEQLLNLLNDDENDEKDKENINNEIKEEINLNENSEMKDEKMNLNENVEMKDEKINLNENFEKKDDKMDLNENNEIKEDLKE
jgi:hypothetical protein